MNSELIEQQYLTEEYEDKIEALVELHSDSTISTADAIEMFLAQCESFERVFVDETSTTMIRKASFSQMTWVLLKEKTEVD